MDQKPRGPWWVSKQRDINIHLDVPGYHHWDNEIYPDLAKHHRHLFTVDIVFKMRNDNFREIEFIDFGNSLMRTIDANRKKINIGGGYDFEGMSCGNIGIEIIKLMFNDYMLERFPTLETLKGEIIITVREDNGHGETVHIEAG